MSDLENELKRLLEEQEKPADRSVDPTPVDTTNDHWLIHNFRAAIAGFDSTLVIRQERAIPGGTTQIVLGDMSKIATSTVKIEKTGEVLHEGQAREIPVCKVQLASNGDPGITFRDENPEAIPFLQDLLAHCLDRREQILNQQA